MKCNVEKVSKGIADIICRLKDCTVGEPFDVTLSIVSSRGDHYVKVQYTTYKYSEGLKTYYEDKQLNRMHRIPLFEREEYLVYEISRDIEMLLGETE